MNSAKGFNLEYKTIYYRFNFSFTIQLFVSLLSLSTNRASQQSVNLFFLSVYNGWVQKAHTTILYPINFLDPILPSNFEPLELTAECGWKLMGASHLLLLILWRAQFLSIKIRFSTLAQWVAHISQEITH